MKNILKECLSFAAYFVIFSVICYVISDEKDIADAIITSLVATASWYIFFAVIPHFRKKS